MNKKLFKSLSILTPIATIGGFIPTFASCSKKEVETFEPTIDAPEGFNVVLSNPEGEIGKDYWTYITSSEVIDNITVSIGDEILPPEAIIFGEVNEEFKYYLKIEGSYITTEEVTIKIIGEPIVETFTITFDAGDGIIAETGKSTMDMDFEDDVVWGQIQDKPTGYLKDFNFDGWSLDKKDPVPTDHIFTGDETVYALYSQCKHDFDSYSIDEAVNPDGTTTRRVKGHCSKCGKSIELSDEQLASLEGSFLVKNEDQTFTLISDQELSFYIGSCSTVSEFDIYPIWGTYEISTSRSEYNQANVRLHGIHDHNGNKTSALDSYNNEIEGQGTEGSIYYNIGISLYLDNMTLQGRDYYDTYHGWNGGIQATYLSCEYCTLFGEMATYSAGNVFKHCHFDSTNFTSAKTDYCIYCYAGPVLIEDCSFVSDGKAIKLYNGKSPHLNEIYDCTFTIVDHVSKDKAAIEIDPYYCSATNKCVVYYDNVSIDETYAGLSLCHINEGYESLVDLHPDERKTD